MSEPKKPLTLAMISEIVEKLKEAQGTRPEYVEIPEHVWDLLRTCADPLVGPWKEPEE